MTMKKGLVATAIAATLMATMAMAPRAEAAPRVIVRPAFGFSYGFGPAWYHYRPWGPAYVYVPGPTTGDVKINASVKGESIYVDGGFAGVTGKLKKFSLQPGNHQIEVRDAEGQVMFQNTVHVIGGKTIDINC
jgi:hypothetical protein